MDTANSGFDGGMLRDLDASTEPFGNEQQSSNSRC